MIAQSMSFSKIISSDQGAREHYHVPKYQREYCWGKAEWEQLLQDIDENDPGYFMGSIICVRDGEETLPGDEIVLEVVDGQQRLTTLSLVMIAIYSKLIALEKSILFADDDDRIEFQTALSNLRCKLVKKKKEPNSKKREYGGWFENRKMCFLRVQPSAQGRNLEDYNYILGDLGIINDVEKPRYHGVRSIAHAYKFFLGKIPDSADELNALLNKINQLMFVHIAVPSQADAFTLFESLNNRGVPLSAIDIIKNKMLAEMDKRHGVNVDESFNKWQKIVDALPDATVQERFLRHFYNAYRWDSQIRVEGISRATKSKLISIYERRIRDDAPAIFDRLCQSAQLYGKLVDPEENSFERKVVNQLVELARINGTPAYQVLLYLFSLPTDCIAEPDFRLRAADLLQRYYVRRNVTDYPVTRDLDQMHMDLIQACQKQVKSKKLLTFSFFRSALLVKGQFADLDRFEKALSGKMYEENAWMTRYLLIKIDELHRNREYAPDFWLKTDAERGQEKYVWTVEHVLPQNENISTGWVKMLADGDRGKASEIHERLLHTLGNLTLSGYNSKLSAADFLKKQVLAEDRKFLGHPINIGYKNGIGLNNLEFKVDGERFSLASAPFWTEEMIGARTKRMCEILLKMYRFEGVE